MLEELFMQGIIFFLLAAVLPLVVAAIFGLLIAVLQAATQIQEQCSPFLLKLIVVSGSLLLLSSVLHERYSELFQLAAKIFISA